MLEIFIFKISNTMRTILNINSHFLQIPVDSFLQVRYYLEHQQNQRPFENYSYINRKINPSKSTITASHLIAMISCLLSNLVDYPTQNTPILLIARLYRLKATYNFMI